MEDAPEGRGPSGGMALWLLGLDVVLAARTQKISDYVRLVLGAGRTGKGGGGSRGVDSGRQKPYRRSTVCMYSIVGAQLCSSDVSPVCIAKLVIGFS